jgi:chloramphenicol-sensitive protein RarD
MPESRRGLLFIIGAYVLWGLFPLYWPLLAPISAVQILSHRVVWSLVVVALLLTVRRGWGSIRALRERPRTVILLGLAGTLIAVNWGLYIWAVNAGHVVETSLGYFINPLISIALGVLFLGERLRRLQWYAVGLTAVAVIVLTIDNGRLPWIALSLAFSFGLYGLVKKTCGVGAVESLGLETAWMAVPAVVFLIAVQANGTGAFGHISLGKNLLLILAGPVTAIPLLLFGAAARRVSLTTIGLTQYLAPVLQFCVGVFIRHEAMPPSRLFGFTLVWVALVLLALESLRHRQRSAVPASEGKSRARVRRLVPGRALPPADVEVADLRP